LGTNYKVTLQFDGTHYHGWQYQTPQIKTIQGEVKRALKIIAKKSVVVTGSSRTDAGVHSNGMIANFFLKIKIAPDSLLRALNSLLPEDIRVKECEAVDKSFNARFHSVKKIYIYKIFFGQTISPFKYRYFMHIPYPLNLKEMRKCIKYFIGEKDFSSFTSDPNRAGEFGDVVISATVPFAKLLFFSGLMPGIMTSEREYAVIGGVYGVDMVMEISRQ